MNLKPHVWSRRALLPSMISLICIFAVTVAAAPQNIEGPIVGVEVLTQKIKDFKTKYVFTGMEVIGVEVVGKNQGKDYNYKYMVVKDSTELEGISFNDFKKGTYIRLRSRGEPPGMVGKPIEEIRPSRFGCCEYALHIDTIHTPRNITGIIKKVESPGSKERVVTVRENKPGALDFKYLILDGQTKFKTGKFSDIKENYSIEIADASVNAPLTPGKWWGELYGAHLYATTVPAIAPSAVAGENNPGIGNSFNDGSLQRTAYTLTGRKIATFDAGDVSTMKALGKKSISKQTLLLKAKSKNGSAKKRVISD